VFLLVAATFSTIYLTQPVLPVLREEFGIDAARASFTVSAVIFGIALARFPPLHWRYAFVTALPSSSRWSRPLRP